MSGPERHYVLVTGGREFRNRQSVEEVLGFLKLFYGDALRVIHGDAKGLDRLVGEVCKEMGISCRAYPADWKNNGKAAGPIRNQHMVNLVVKWTTENENYSGQVIAWPGGRGTAHCSRTAEQAGLSVDYMPTTTAT